VTRPRQRRPPALLLLAGAAVALLVLLPLGETVLQASRLPAATGAELLFRPLVGELLANTLALIAATTLACAVLGTAAAWCVERTRLPFARVWAVLVAVPLAIPAFISSYAWVSLSPRLQDFAGAWLVVSCAYCPLVYLPVAAAIRGLDPALEESGRALGLSPTQCFWRVVLPQLRPALLGGVLLVALNTLTEFGAFALLRFRTFTTEIYTEYRVGIDGPPAALLAVLLVLLCVICLALEWRIVGRARYARVAGGVRRRGGRIALGWLTVPVLAGFAVFVVASLAVPLGTIGYWMTRHGHAATTPVAATLGALVRAALSSIELGTAGAALTLVLALPLGVLASRFNSRVVTLLERCAYLAQGVPGIVVALALVSMTVRALQPLYQSAALLVFAYAVLFLPLALVSVRAALAQAQPGLEEAGRVLGLNWMQAAWRIARPLAAPGLGAAAALVFVSVVTELTATLLLAPIGTRTLATQVWADTSSLAFAAAAPYAGVMAALSLISTWVLARRFGRNVVLGHV
jgi:iron(III) transport system permease protein